MRTLAGMFELMGALGRREALRSHNGYRTRKLSYRDLLRHSGAFARFLDERGLHKGDRLILWAENRPEWAAVFWACVARGVEVVPIDFRSSPQLVARIQREVGAKLLVSGDEVEASKLDVETF
jgi:long-chain acyl-CoA synthetase